jgi:Reverse transcriptase (RNA-dependent DNA polymerase)
LKKSYDTLERGRTIDILKGYGVDKMTCNLIKTIWGNDVMVPKQAGFYGKPLKASRGARQGDIMSPIIFNITTDDVIRESLKQFYNIYPKNTDTQANFMLMMEFYAEMMQKKTQFLLDIFTTNFARIGLKMNVEKTKSLIMNGGKMSQKLSNIDYNRMVTNTGVSFQERQKEDITCELCGKQLKAGSIKTSNHTTLYLNWK